MNVRKDFDGPSINIAQFIDHTLLKPDATNADVAKLCEEALLYGFASVCVHPAYVRLATDLLNKPQQKTSGDTATSKSNQTTDRTPIVKVGTVIGFPLGANSMRVKAFETEDAVGHGAQEVDMVINVGALKSGEYELVEKDIRAVVQSAEDKAIVKVILETALLTDEEKEKACRLAERAGAHYVKTSTGFASAGAEVSDVKLMRQLVGDRLGVKASGGIRTVADARQMINAGASRIGTSHGVAIVQASLDNIK